MSKRASTASAQREGDLHSAVAFYLPNLIYGANDGIVTTLVVVSGVAGAALSSNVVVILGFVNLLADGFSMGTSNVLSVRSTVTAEARPSLTEAAWHGLVTFAGFVAAGLLPLLAYLLPIPDEVRFPAACTVAAGALFTIGAGRALFSDRSWSAAGIEMLVLGTVAAGVAYGVGAIAAALVRLA